MRQRPGALALATGAAATGITLDQQNGAIGESGTMLIKGFNPTNPHLGDAIVATFVWVGSTYIIDSVTDVLTTNPYTPVGNKYTLVEYVTSGGISMATYVATNVQNFPDPNPTSGQVLAVRANLSASVTDGGVLLSAWTGVNAVAAQALGNHSSRAGAGSGPTVADPGPIAMNAGALAYAVTLSNGLVGRDRPTGFTYLTASGADTKLVDDGDYAMQASAGTVEPQWTWYFNAPSTWLATVLALNPGTPPPPPGPAAKLAFTVQPSSATAGSAISPPVQVAAQDNAGTTNTSFTGSITIALGTNPSGGTLAGTTTVAAVNGIATFSNLSIDKTGTGYTLQATASGLTSATSTTFNITAPPPPPPTGLALDQWNSTLNESGTMLVKGFNPTNPHVGDAIVATFVWVGSTNIIDSVTDVLTTNPYTPVGNKYTLVEYVTSGGISMATYVASNVQNFPDASTNSSQTLAVRANLSTAVTDGGLILSAWTGVNAVAAQALGNHSSRAGAGAGPTVADPGPIAVNAGALAYAVTLSNGLVGRDRPASFTYITSESDTKLVDDASYAVQASAGPVEPQWTWYFNAPSTWLATVLALNPAPALPPPLANFTSSCTGLTCGFDASSSTARSTATYSWTWGDNTTGTGKTPTHTYPAAGSYSVALTVTDAGGSSTKTQSVMVVPPPVANFTSSCSALTCTFDASSSQAQTTATYSWTWGDNTAGSGKTPTHAYPAAGSYSVALTVTDAGGSSTTTQSVTVVPPPVANFTSRCSALTCSFDASGTTAQANATYSWNWGDGTAGTGKTTTHTYRSWGNYNVTLTVTDGGGSSSKTQMVTANQPPIVNAGPNEMVLLGLLYTESATFSDPDNDGPWSYRIDWGDGSASSGSTSSQGTITGTHTYLLTGQYTIRVTVLDSRGASGSSTKVLTVIL
jgi:PKD repeat protein